MPTLVPDTHVAAPQDGERGASVEQAWLHGQAAIDELGLTAQLDPVPGSSPGAWRCTLYSAEERVPRGTGLGRGAEETASTGAVFEALEHHLSATTPDSGLLLPGAHEAAAGVPTWDAALAPLAEGPDVPLACRPYRSMADGSELALPAFLSTPGYADRDQAERSALGDDYDYTAVRRYPLNSGWAAGTTLTEATVHAINEVVERDALSTLLLEQFLRPKPDPLPVLDPAGLPGPLARLHGEAQERAGAPVWLVRMTTGRLGVPVYWAYTPAGRGTRARLHGCGASLSPRRAVEQALTERIQTHCTATAGGGGGGRHASGGSRASDGNDSDGGVTGMADVTGESARPLGRPVPARPCTVPGSRTSPSG